MKKILFLIFVFALAPISANAACSGDDIGTDYWGRTYGCACNGGGVNEQKSRGNTIISVTPGQEMKCSGCWLFCNDRWDSREGGFCDELAKTKHNDDVIIKMNEARRCWEYRCPDGMYFEGKADGTINRKKCMACNGLSKSISDGICWDVPCGAGSGDTSELTKNLKFGSEAVIYNGKCMPVCDLQTSGAVYDTNDSTFINIRIKTKNAGSVGKDLTRSTPISTPALPITYNPTTNTSGNGVATIKPTITPPTGNSGLAEIIPVAANPNLNLQTL